MNKSFLLAIIITVFAILWIGSGYIFPTGTPDVEISTITTTEQGEKSDVMKVKVTPLNPQEYTHKVSASGRSMASKNVVMRAETDGQVKHIYAREGDAVKKGQPILRIDIREREQRVKEGEELVKQRQIEYDAAQRLSKQGYASEVRVAETESALEAASANLTQSQIDLEKTTITAPFNGILGKRYVDIGDYLQIGNEITDIVDLNPLKVTAYVNENEVLTLRKGDPATLIFSNKAMHDGRVAFISPAADSETRTFQIDVKMDNPGNVFPAGITARVEITIDTEMAYQIPPSILTLNDAGDIGVKIVNDDGIVEFIDIKILDSSSDLMWVDGLSGTPQAIIVGQDFVSVGQQVDAVEDTQ